MTLSRFFLLALCVSVFVLPSTAVDPTGTVILDDTFDRDEAKPESEDVGGGWSTNSKSRAQGVKQVDLDGGAMHIYRAEVADHGVSVVHDLKFKDATIQLRFKIGKNDTLGINIADMKEKSVHAGHICMAQVRCGKVEIADLKTGRMELEMRKRRKAKQDTDEDKKLLKKKSKYFDTTLTPDTWHDLQVKIAGDTMTVSIDGQKIGEFTSTGIGHETKGRLRLAVAKSAWVDDVKVWRQ